MNILIPDSWLRDHLDTKATPKQLKEYLSLCGPSIERVNTVDGETVYDIEITTNRVDAFSVRGIAREASVILPEFGIPATLKPFSPETKKGDYPKQKLDITFENDATLCYRILAIKFSDIQLKESPDWIKKRLELVGQRPLNNIVDITNYVMWEVGHPLHVFDYDRLTGRKIIVRLGKKGEKLTTLNEKTHTLRGGEIVFDDGTGTIIDLPGIMGTANTVVTDKTKNCLLFIENSDQVRIRRTSMGLAIRSQAAVINEKHPDPELGLVAMRRAIELTQELTGGTITSELVDIYPAKPKPKTITVEKHLIDQYLGKSLETKQIETILTRLDFSVSTQKQTDGLFFEVKPPTWRSDDVTIPEDVIEEVARISGYHNITPRLPDREPPPVLPDPTLTWEEEIKRRLRDWGYTEIYTYSMISEKLLRSTQVPVTSVYTIANPLTVDHVYLRPSLVPSMFEVIAQNNAISDSLSLFELSHIYEKREKDLPHEQSKLVIATNDTTFLKMKGLAQAIFSVLGIPFPDDAKESSDHWYAPGLSLSFGEYGSLGIVDAPLLTDFGIKTPVTLLSLSFDQLALKAKDTRSYTPVSKHPPVIEDLSFVVPPAQFVGPMIKTIKTIDPLITQVMLLDAYENRRTFRIAYLHPDRTLTGDEIKPIREKIIAMIEKTFHCSLLK